MADARKENSGLRTGVKRTATTVLASSSAKRQSVPPSKRQTAPPAGEPELRRPLYDLKLPTEGELHAALVEHIAWDRLTPESTAELEKLSCCDGDGATLSAALARSALDTLATSHHLCQATVSFSRYVSGR
jgi:hypothetical protein